MRHANAFSIVMALLIMALAVLSVPYPGSLLLVGAATIGVVIAVWRIRRAGVGVSAAPTAASAPDRRSTRVELEQGWSATGAHLSDAMRVVSAIDLGMDGRRHMQDARESLEHNELALAMESLVEAASDHVAVPDAFWAALELAASNMRLQDRAADFRRRASERRGPGAVPNV